MLTPEALKRFQKKHAHSATQGIQIIRKCAAMDKPEAIPPEIKYPDPWLMDSEVLLNELTRLRELALRVPVHNNTVQPIQTVIDALWRIESRLRYMLHLHLEGQRSFAKRSTKTATPTHKQKAKVQVIADQKIVS